MIAGQRGQPACSLLHQPLCNAMRLSRLLRRPLDTSNVAGHSNTAAGRVFTTGSTTTSSHRGRRHRVFAATVVSNTSSSSSYSTTCLHSQSRAPTKDLLEPTFYTATTTTGRRFFSGQIANAKAGLVYKKQNTAICFEAKRGLTLETKSSCILVETKTKPDKDINMTPAKIISGKEVAEEIRSELKAKVVRENVRPKLVIVQVGGREDSNVYIRMKVQFAESVGVEAQVIKFERTISEQELASKIDTLNKDEQVHGIITQLPFDCSEKIDSDRIVNMIEPSKDVDGLSVYNAGKLSHGELDGSSFVPCTPNGCLRLIRKSGLQIEGSNSVVIGRSKIVGSPMAQLLLWHNSTVTICHSKTKNLDEICRRADLVVAGVGRPQMVKSSWLKPGAVVIDCGINLVPDATKKSGTRLVGDVDFEACQQVASAITPVPGGVGPMTVAMLISNTVESACRSKSSGQR